MKWSHGLFTLLLGLSTFFSSRAQQDSCHLTVSLLTCGPGEDLYSVFGHSALRVRDAVTNTDIIFNYGTFDFDDPDFYVKFVQGKLLYFVSVERFTDFARAYRYENRSIIEQQLNITCEEKAKLYQALRVNAEEENKYYKYEFLFDNCSTRLRDIVANNTRDTLTFKRILPYESPTFRDMIHAYLDMGKKYWSEFGIDLVLASRIDRPVQNEEAMFLPDYLMKGFDSAVLKNATIVGNKQVILENEPQQEEKVIFTPLFVTMSLLIIGLVLTFLNTPQVQRVRNVFDIAYFLILGIIGCFMLFMWFGTSHELCRDNYNVLWALPSHVVIAFFIQKKNGFVKKYFIFTAVLCALFILLLPVIPQGMNYAFIPLILLTALRGAYRALKM
jgi:hypothetical protein